MLLLNIYYDYYCNNKLALISSLLEIIENVLQLSSEEFRVFSYSFTARTIYDWISIRK